MQGEYSGVFDEMQSAHRRNYGTTDKLLKS